MKFLKKFIQVSRHFQTILERTKFNNTISKNCHLFLLRTLKFSESWKLCLINHVIFTYLIRLETFIHKFQLPFLYDVTNFGNLYTNFFHFIYRVIFSSFSFLRLAIILPKNNQIFAHCCSR